MKATTPFIRNPFPVKAHGNNKPIYCETFRNAIQTAYVSLQMHRRRKVAA